MNYSPEISDMCSNDYYEVPSLQYEDPYYDTSSDNEVYMRCQIPQLFWFNLQLRRAALRLRPYYDPDPSKKPTLEHLREVVQHYEEHFDYHKILMAQADFDVASVYRTERENNRELLMEMETIKMLMKMTVSRINEQVKQQMNNQDSPVEVPNDPRPCLLRKILFAEFILENFSHVKDGIPSSNLTVCTEPYQEIRIPVVGESAPRKRQLPVEQNENSDPIKDPDGPSPEKRRKLNWEQIIFLPSAGLWLNNDVTFTHRSDKEESFADDEDEAFKMASIQREKVYRKKRHARSKKRSRYGDERGHGN